MNKGLLFTGTSGWSYKEWLGIFYPEKTKPVDFLKYYCKQFNAVEVNSSFYNTLKEKTILHWYEEVPENFIFSVKADRYITHMKKLEEPEKTVPDFIRSLSSFKNKLGPILFQLPPSLAANTQKLKAFVKVLPHNKSYVMEFRNKTWFNEETYGILKEKNIALCIYNLKGYQSPMVSTADFVYARFHGTTGLGAGQYSKEDIADFAKKLTEIASDKEKIFCYFNNDGGGAAVLNAKEFIEAF